MQQHKATGGFIPHPQASEIATKLWHADKNRLQPGVDYDLDLQGYTKSYQRQDRARNPLFSWVREEVFQKETYKAFIALLDNYERSTGRAEVVTPEEIAENHRFIDLIMLTEPMKVAHDILKHKKVPEDVRGFKHQLYQIWFEMYSRTKGNRNMDSSGFEHVFVGESRNKDVIGFHNWIQFYLQEKNGQVDYQGYIRSRGVRGKPSEDTHLISIQFEWKDQVKPVGSSFIGTSPEFEIALYTVCFLMDSSGETNLEIDDMDVTIITHRFNCRGKLYIGSSFPKAA